MSLRADRSPVQQGDSFKLKEKIRERISTINRGGRKGYWKEDSNYCPFLATLPALCSPHTQPRKVNLHLCPFYSLSQAHTPNQLPHIYVDPMISEMPIFQHENCLIFKLSSWRCSWDEQQQLCYGNKGETQRQHQFVIVKQCTNSWHPSHLPMAHLQQLHARKLFGFLEERTNHTSKSCRSTEYPQQEEHQQQGEGRGSTFTALWEVPGPALIPQLPSPGCHSQWPVCSTWASPQLITREG